jgi:hypothetical protein
MMKHLLLALPLTLLGCQTTRRMHEVDIRWCKVDESCLVFESEDDEGYCHRTEIPLDEALALDMEGMSESCVAIVCDLCDEESCDSCVRGLVLNRDLFTLP